MSVGRVVRSGMAVVSGVSLLLVASAGAMSEAQASEGLQISEVRADAGRGAEDAAFELVEIHNLGDTAVEVEGWSLADNRGEDLLPALTVDPRARVVVGGSAALAAEFPAGTVFAAVADGRIGNGLANSGDRVLLVDARGEAVDGVSWGNDRSLTVLPAPPRGQTLQWSAGGDWSAGAPSPGEAGGDTVVDLDGPPPGLRIREIFANAGEGTRDAAFEWIEVHNPTDEAVELEGWQLNDNSATDVLPPGRLEPGASIVVAAMAEAVDPQVPHLTLEDGRLGNGLANGGDVVTLRDPAGRVVDEVDYRSPPLPLPEAGRSIALTEAGWVLNTESSPGSDAVVPLLAGLATPLKDDRSAPPAIQPEGEGGVPAWGLVAIALGLPLGAVAGLALWRRREAAGALLRPRGSE